MKNVNKSSTAESLVFSGESTSGEFGRAITDMSAARIPVENLRRTAARPGKSTIENAIYAHIRALRALGRKTIYPAEIAEALTLSLEEVRNALNSLRKKGVKPL